MHFHNALLFHSDALAPGANWCGQIAFCIFRIVRRAQSRMTAPICCCSARRDCACFHSRSLSSDRAFCLFLCGNVRGRRTKKNSISLSPRRPLYARVRPNFRPLNQKSHDFRLDFPRSCCCCCWRLIAGEPGAAYAPIHLHEFTINFRISRAYLCEYK
jgi:hypothetical protein